MKKSKIEYGVWAAAVVSLAALHCFAGLPLWVVIVLAIILG
jgi:hypothetical protein